MAVLAAIDLFRDLFIIPDFDNAEVRVTFSCPRGATINTWHIKTGRKVVASGRIKRQKGKIRIVASLTGFTPWTVDDPFLYTLCLSVRNGCDTFEVAENFGMRKLHTADGRIYLNNRPFFIRGFLRGLEAHDHPNLLGLDEEEFHARNIRQAKRFGFNFVRFHSMVPPPGYFAAADRLGMLIHVEARRWKIVGGGGEPVNPREWRATIRRLRNHASLMVYCLGNEIEHPGRQPDIAERASDLRRLDPTRLFVDTCARGEYDRGNIDLDVQHMGYFAPFGHTHNMYNTTSNWDIFGSVTGKEMVAETIDAKTRRVLSVNHPTVAHEVCHLLVLRDIDKLAGKFTRSGHKPPWWIDELKKLRQSKGLVTDYPKMLAASRHFQRIWHKQIIESIRRSPFLCGFHMLQLADGNVHENANGIIDCFDESKGVTPSSWRAFNQDSVLIADLPRRTFFEREELVIPVHLSHYGMATEGEGTFSWGLKSRTGEVDIVGRLQQLEFASGSRQIAELAIELPRASRPLSLALDLAFKPRHGKTIRNAWTLWLYPNRPNELCCRRLTAALTEIDLARRYPHLEIRRDVRRPEKLFVTDRFSNTVFNHLARGGDVLMLYRIQETRDRAAPREHYYMPSVRDRFKPVIWDRGHNLGGFVRNHTALDRFPVDDFIDFQFAGLIDDADKLSLDDFPVPVLPIIQGVDKAVRDRFDVHTFKLREFQSDWTMRKFAYLFDLRIGKGRLMMSGFNFTGLMREGVEAAVLFESLVGCVTGEAWCPAAKISIEALKRYLARKGRARRIKERMMTQYWQLDAEPLESEQYWKESEAWIRAD